MNVNEPSHLFVLVDSQLHDFAPERCRELRSNLLWQDNVGR